MNPANLQHEARPEKLRDATRVSTGKYCCLVSCKVQLLQYDLASASDV